jgi:S1/P1 Nuclease
MRLSTHLTLLAWAATVPCAYGWGHEGHDLVARLAAARLTPKAAAQVAEILGPADTLVSTSSWADQVRNSRKETGPWHYVNISIDKPHLNMQRDCGDGNCVIARIEQFQARLADKNLPAPQRREALMFLVHFVGDMHQPLHCSDNNDKGGNDVKLEFFGRPTNLHSLWDSGLLARMGSEDALFEEMSRELTPKRARKFAKGNVRNWAEQSHRQGQVTVYGKLPKHETTLKLGEAYERPADLIVREQLERAGARLAKLLNATLN